MTDEMFFAGVALVWLPAIIFWGGIWVLDRFTRSSVNRTFHDQYEREIKRLLGQTEGVGDECDT